jgi:AraC-like DNA-binding protein
MVRLGTSVAIPAVLRELGLDPVEVFQEAGVDLKLFEDPDNIISYAARNHLVEVCVARSGCRHFGLLIGQRVGLPSIGLAGYLVRHSPDIGTALESLVRYFHLHTHGAAITLEKSNGVALMSFNILQPNTEACDQVGDGAVAILFNSLQSLCGQDWRPRELLFAHRKPENIEPFRKFFQAPLRFDAETHGVAFHSEWLAKPVQNADPDLYRMLRKQVQALEAEDTQDFPGRVRRVLRSALLTGHANEERIADLFSMNSRTLRRRLQVSGTSFIEVADQARYEMAKQLLETSTQNVASVASTLHYADASSFTRAFKRWSGTTPCAWRSARLAHIRSRR